MGEMLTKMGYADRPKERRDVDKVSAPCLYHVWQKSFYRPKVRQGING
jgi:hypothetical protein